MLRKEQLLLQLDGWEIANPDDPQICDVDGKGTSCEDDQECRTFWEGPNNGITSFDNIFAGMLTVFQVITNEGWTDIMYQVCCHSILHYTCWLIMQAITVSTLYFCEIYHYFCQDVLIVHSDK